MRRIWISLLCLAAAGVTAQNNDEVTQSGTPAVLEAVNGKQARVFLQGLKDGNLTFQAYKSTRDITVGMSKIKSLTFYPKYDAEAVKAQNSAGDYDALIATLAPVLADYSPYMIISNNLREPFVLLMEAYRKAGDYARVKEMASILMETAETDSVQRGLVNLALVAIEENDLDTAIKFKGQITSEAAGLYLQACIEREQGQPKTAIRTVSSIIIKHANEVDWLAPSELLCANLYMDMLSTNSVITTNSPLHTARQVKNMYKGTSDAADAEKLWASLGGADLEAAIRAEKEEQKRRQEELRVEAEARRAEREAERKAAQEAEKKAAEEAEAVNEAEGAEAAATNVTTTATIESE
jgi:hypothetical protein